MLHKVFGRKLNRTANERKRLFKNLVRSLILTGNIKTTLAKAKAVQPLVEKLVTKAKENSLVTRRLLLHELNDNRTVDKLLKDIGPLFKSRAGGYTRILKLINQEGDNAVKVSLSFTENVINSELVEKKLIVNNKKNATDKTDKKK